MRKLSPVAVLTALAFSSGVSATTVNLRWTGASDGAVLGLGTSTVDVRHALGPVLLTLDVVIGVDAAGLSAASLDLEFDTDTLNELDLVSWSEFSWGNAKASSSLTQLSVGIARTQESQTNGAEGQTFGFEAFTLGTGPTSVTITFARVVFSTSAARVLFDGIDIFSTNERNPLATAFFNNAGVQLAIAPLSATVDTRFIPEPGTIGLLGLGLTSLAAASRWRA